MKVLQCLCKILKDVMQFCCKCTATVVQNVGTRTIYEQIFAQFVLELSDLPAYSSVGDVQFVCRRLQRVMPGCRFESAQCVERGKADRNTHAFVISALRPGHVRLPHE